jgi:type II secretory pathway pseudopilin PulG
MSDAARRKGDASLLVVLILLVLALGGGYLYYRYSAQKTADRTAEILESLDAMQKAAQRFFQEDPEKLDDEDFQNSDKFAAARSLAKYLGNVPSKPVFMLLNVNAGDTSKWYVGYNLSREKKDVRQALKAEARRHGLFGNLNRYSSTLTPYRERNSEVWASVSLPDVPRKTTVVAKPTADGSSCAACCKS